MKLFLALFFATTLTVAAQSPEVPHKMQFADITLTIRDDARREIQKDVDALTRYAKAFNVKVERAKTYFPLIEKVFAEEGLPDDFKFLAIQESALVPDAVSTSNAVGFWQFKDFTAMEMGLRVDKEIDERLNIVSSSRAAAKYLKKNNTFFDNWLFALQAYQMGAGGVMRSEKETKSGVKHMEVTSNTYWYVKKYLAHKIAYESAIKGEAEVSMLTYHTRARKSLQEIASETAADLEEMKLYNKWVKGSVIPDDRSYAVMIPVKGNVSTTSVRIPDAMLGNADPTVGLRDTAVPKGKVNKQQDRIRINGITAIKALTNETPTRLAERAGVDISMFLKWNDISISDRLDPGKFYFLGKKRSRAATAYHKVSKGESMWSVSQQYGVQMKKLRRYNRLKSDSEVKPGMTLWLSALKPRDAANPVEDAAIVEVDKSAAFSWEVPQAEKVIESTTPEVVVIPATKVEDAPNSDTYVPQGTDSTRVNEPIQETANTTNVPANPNFVVEESKVPSDKTEHIVQPKETLYAIAKIYGVGVMDLVNWNSLNLQEGIKVGQVIRVKSPEEETAKTMESAAQSVEHEVKPSDTVYSIARKYGVTIRELMEWNNKKDFTLTVGEKLRVVRK